MKSKITYDLAAGLSSRLLNWLTNITIVIALLLMPVVVTPVLDFNSGSLAVAGNGNGSGGGGSGSGGGGSGGGNNGSGLGGSKGQGGGNNPAKGDLYGDMVYLLRSVDGIPVVDEMGCLQPLDVEGNVLPLSWWPEPVDIPETCNVPEEPEPALVVAAEEAEEVDDCEVIPVCATSTEETDLGRLSVLRSPAKVLDRHRDEAIRNIGKANGQVALDQGGRLMVPGPTVDSEWATFDSPLVNMALMREFHRWGVLWQDANGDNIIDNNEIVFDPGTLFGNQPPSPFDTYSYALASAFGLGAGDDKEGIGIDTEVVARVNSILGLANMAPYIGTIEDPDNLWLGKFIDYRDFDYSRWNTYPGCITWDEWDEQISDWVEKSDTIVHAVFGDEVDPGWFSNIEAFALSANDAREVLLFTHDIGDDALRGRVDKVFENTEEFCPELDP